MSNSAGPKITKDGLVLDFDAANLKSYNFYADPYASNVSLYLQMNGANGSTTFTDSSPNALTVTAAGNAQISTTQSKYNGSAGYFDGNGYLNPSSSTGMLFATGDFTVEFWFYANSLSATAYSALMGFHNGGTEDWGAFARSNGIWIYGGGVGLVGGGTVATGTWHHFAASRNGSTVTTFLNGTQVGIATNVTGNYTNNAGNIFRIGDDYTAINPSFNGYIDELKITKGVARYTSAFTSPPIPSTCTDLTRSKNVGTLTGGVDYNFSNGGSLVFDGANDYITVTNSGLFNFGTGDFTIDVWAKVNGYSAGSIQTLINTYTNPSAGWNIQFNVFNTLDFRFSYGDTTLIISGANAILLNEWNNLVISRINNSLVMYVNGSNITSATDSTNIASGSALVLGRNSPSAIQFLNGNISLARVYKARGLTSGEVYNNFVANRGRFFVSTPITLPVSGAVLWLDASRQATLFTDAGTTQVATSGQSIYQWNDLSGNNRHATQATLGNRPTWVSPAGGQNGLGAVSFNGATTYLSIADTAGLQFGTGDFTLFFAGVNSNVSRGAAYANTFISKGYTNIEFYQYQGLIQGYIGGTSNSPTTGSGTVSNNSSYIAHMTRSGGSTYVAANNVSGASVTNTANANGSGTNINIGSRSPFNTTLTYLGSMYEILAFNWALSPTEITSVQSYLKTKWGIS
jgi:hypothetical protein